jgi:DNA-binding response OmpR family regulator
MRKRRIIIYDDQKIILHILTCYFSQRNYQVVTFESPDVCPIDYKNSSSCENYNACADIIISDLMMPGMNGVDLFKAQSLRVCKVSTNHKALMSGNAGDDRLLKMQGAGYKIFTKPISFSLLSEWLDKLEPEMDLSQPLGITRKERRHQTNQEVTCILGKDALTLKGIATNMSLSGLCLKIDVPVTEEQKLSVLFDRPGEYRPALVRWKREVEEGHYLAGLSFV